ncbi:MAG TPA: DUF1552 domain-containing protein [Candidatus Solibacter sp.]|nr:DUF1552 domain-containing protein [Candidatus Solibacter sp.]
MIITRKHIPRRTFLRGMGAAIALPWLDAMHPALAATPRSPMRASFVYVPNGIVMPAWKPKVAGRDFEFTRILKPLEPFRENITVLSGLDQRNGFALGDGPGDHARAGATWLTGVHPKKTAGADIAAGISADQVLAEHLAGQTKFASIELGCEEGRTVGNCDSGYSCAYSNSISWRGPASPMPPESDPRIIFERLFGADDIVADPAARMRRMEYRKSILDMVQDDTRRLATNLGKKDKLKLDEYLFAVREIEQRIERAEKDHREFTPDMEKPAGVPVLFSEHVKLMFDLQIAAFQGDLTRVGTFMVGREGSTRVYNEIGLNDQHHPLTHHRNDPQMVEKVTQINCFHVEQFAYFVKKLKETRDGEGSLLDHSMILYGSSLADGNSHSHADLPLVMAGAKGGQYLVYPKGSPMTNLLLTMLDRAGVHPEKIGDSNGRLEHLSEL